MICMGISLRKLLVILAIVALIFGTTRLRNLGADLAAAIRGLHDALHDNKCQADTGPTGWQTKQIGSKYENECKRQV